MLISLDFRDENDGCGICGSNNAIYPSVALVALESEAKFGLFVGRQLIVMPGRVAVLFLSYATHKCTVYLIVCVRNMSRYCVNNLSWVPHALAAPASHSCRRFVYLLYII